MPSLGLFQRDLRAGAAVSQAKARQALLEDAGKDVTTNALKLKGKAHAFIVAKESGVLCGVLEANAALQGLNVGWKVKEGHSFKKGQVLCEISGEAKRLLAGERTALNYLMILSGIATLTRGWVEKFGPRVATLRKTHPLLSASEKRAVLAGGGLTHRLTLADGYLVKENHVSALANERKLSRLEALKLAVRTAKRHREASQGKERKRAHRLFVEVEVRSFSEAVAAAGEKPDALLVDNCTAKEVRRIVNHLRPKYPKMVFEASGGINEKNASFYLRAGADFVSSSALTLQARPIDLSLLLE